VQRVVEVRGERRIGPRDPDFTGSAAHRQRRCADGEREEGGLRLAEPVGGVIDDRLFPGVVVDGGAGLKGRDAAGQVDPGAQLRHVGRGVAVDAGATAISVSDHGGNNLDTTPATIRLLPAIADAVGDEIEVLLDGGIRRGSDVVKALALGARAVMIGRAYLWGLAANGQAGVENVLDILRSGIDSTLMGLCRGSVRDLTRKDVLVPRDFVRMLDASGVARQA
jgi:isopentenyl diphosphate isomerase/L-lactate dehydrogenase-like FMN-dependent dehydrogenase